MGNAIMQTSLTIGVDFVAYEDIIEAETSLSRVYKACKSIDILIKVAFVVFCVAWLFSTFFMAYSLFNPEMQAEVNELNVFRVFLHLAYGFVIAFIFAIFIGIFSDVAKGNSPFVMKQVKRFRLIALLFVVYAVLDFLISSNNILMQFGGMVSGYVSTNDSAIVSVNVMPLVFAGIFFALSFVFQYGVLLQDFSDEAI